jgi:hypothetical protein
MSRRDRGKEDLQAEPIVGLYSASTGGGGTGGRGGNCGGRFNRGACCTRKALGVVGIHDNAGEPT